MAVGFAANKTKILPDSTGKVLAKLENWVFVPALCFVTMMRYCTPELVTVHATNVSLSAIGALVAVGMAIPLSCLFVKKAGMERGVYAYGLAVANSGYMGDPIVQALFGDEVLAYYKLFCLPISLVIYTWGISVLTPAEESGRRPFLQALRRLLNAPTISIFAGIFMGLTGWGQYLPTFFLSSLDSLKMCMGPVGMLLAGFTIARYRLGSMLKNTKVYVVTLLRLTALPAVIILVLLLVKTLAESAFGISIGHDVLFLCFFATATPLGLNTVIFPEAYNGSPETGAGMTMISHTLCVLTIPLLYTLMVSLFGVPFGG